MAMVPRSKRTSPSTDMVSFSRKVASDAIALIGYSIATNDAMRWLREAVAEESNLKWYLQLQILHAGLRRAHQRHHLALGRAVLMHDLMALGDLVEAERPREARIDFAVDDQLIECV